MDATTILTFIPGQDSSADVAAQKFLAAEGYYEGKIDGLFWSESKAALRNYLNDHAPATPISSDHYDNLADSVLAASKIDVGLYETVDNTTWAMQGTGSLIQGQAFKAGLESIGWQPPESYCAAGVKWWCKQGFAQAGRDFTDFGHILGLGCVDTYQRAVQAGVTTRSPAPGDIGVMRHGTSSQGHMFLVRSVGAGVVYTREANTSPAPTDDPNVDRNGGCVTDKSRVLSFEHTSGLYLLGFLRLPV